MGRNVLYDEIYRSFGTDWAFGRRSVGQVLVAARAAGPRHKSLSPSQKAQLARLVSNSPQAMLKIVSRTNNAKSLKNTVDYISRDGELDVETSYGTLREPEDIEVVRNAWSESYDWVPRDRRYHKASLSVHMVLSMPAGTDRGHFKEAVRAFVHREIAANNDYMLSFHDDTAQPHGHVVIETRGTDGKAFRTELDRLDVLRARFAETLREHGIDADATPRHSRGIDRRSPGRGDFYRNRAGSFSRHQTAHVREKVEELAGRRSPRPQPWRQAIELRRQAVVAIYDLAVNELSRSADHVDRHLANRLQAYSDRMIARPIRTRDDLYREEVSKAQRQKHDVSATRQTVETARDRQHLRDPAADRNHDDALARIVINAAAYERAGRLLSIDDKVREFLRKIPPSMTPAALLGNMERDAKVLAAVRAASGHVAVHVRSEQAKDQSPDLDARGRPAPER